MTSTLLPELGTIALCLALIVALVQAVLPLIGALKNNQAMIDVGRPAALVLGTLVLLAFGVLMHGFVVSDFSIRTVAANSHTLKPMLYKLAGTWGNHEGSLVLWVLILALFGAALAVKKRQGEEARFYALVLSVQAMIAVGFLAFSLFTSNPFERLDPVPIEGNGLNPLLQDPGLAFHPPFLYLGYVGFSIAFAFAIAALIDGKVDRLWAARVRPWVMSAWTALTFGIGLGSWWAYYELGWGGFWFWDPVENASFMPWLMGTALIHSIAVVEKRGLLKSWTVLLAISTFSLSLLGTFLVRSGVLTSVHAFATDPARGIYILGFLILSIGGALLLYGVRAKSLAGGEAFKPVSREGALLVNNWLLASGAGTVLLGTLYPLLLDAVTGQKISVGPPFFELTFLPIMAPLVVLMGVGPWLAWRHGAAKAVRPYLLGMVGLTALFAAIVYLANQGVSLAPLLGMSVGIWLVAGTLIDFLRRGLGQPLRAYGMATAHLGIASVALGIFGHAAFLQEGQDILKPGQSLNAGKYRFTLEKVEELPGPNYVANRATITVGEVTLRPELRRFDSPPQSTTEAGIRPHGTGDLFVAVGEGDAVNGYAVRAYAKPMISFLWLGIFLMGLGGLFSLFGRTNKEANRKEGAQ